MDIKTEQRLEKYRRLCKKYNINPPYLDSNVEKLFELLEMKSNVFNSITHETKKGN